MSQCTVLCCLFLSDGQVTKAFEFLETLDFNAAPIGDEAVF